MRNLTNTELEAVSGAVMVSRKPVVPKSIFGVRLTRTHRIVLAAVLSLFRPRKPAAE